MATITKGKTFTNGELVTPAALHSMVDSGTVTNIVNADISPSAAIADSKLAQIATAGKVLPAAVAGTAVITTDSRLSDARTPSAHTHVIADTTGLQTALDGKAAAMHYHDASNIITGTISNARTTATSANTSNAIVSRDANGDFQANSITASSATSSFGAVKIGRGSGWDATNTSVGGGSPLSSITTGLNNTCVGYNSQNKTNSGSRNISVGQESLFNNTSGNKNIAIGTLACNLNSTGSQNVAVGDSALYNNVLSSGNTAIGDGSLNYNTTGNNNTAIGNLAGAFINNYSNSTCVGYNSAVTNSNQLQLGDSTATTYAYGAVQDRSDVRDKADIRDTTLGLDFVNALRPVDFKWDMREDYRPEAPQAPDQDASQEAKAAYQTAKAKWMEDVKLANITHDGSKKRGRYHHGLIAQEVKAVLDSKGIDFGGYQDHSIKGGDDVLSIGYEELIAPMLKAIQELAARVAALEAK